MIQEDVKPGYAPKEISFRRFTTSNLHHSGDATKAFQDTIERVGDKHPREVLNALVATDKYMKLNDMHLEQGKTPDEKEIRRWKVAHQIARDSLNSIGEFMHHEDYWHTHEHELQDMLGNYNPQTAGAEMADSFNPQGNQLTESASRFIQKVNQAANAAASGKHKNAQMHLDNARSFMLGVKSSEMSKIKDAHETYKNLRKKYSGSGGDYTPSHDQAGNAKVTKEEAEISEELTDKTIRSGDKIKVARVIADMLGVENAEGMSPEMAINTGLRGIKSKRMTPELVGVIGKMLKLASEVGVKYDSKLVPKAVSEAAIVRGDGDDDEDDNNTPDSSAPNVDADSHTKVGSSINPGGNDQVRRMKVKMKTESMEPEDQSSLEQDMMDELDLSDEELDKIANEVDDADDILDVYDDEELAVANDDTQEITDVPPSSVNEEALTEVLSRAARIRMRAKFIQTAARRSARLRIVLKRRSDTRTLTKRAHHLAVRMMKEKLAKKPVEQMSVSEKERVESIIAKRKGAVARLAMKLMPRIRQIETDRMSHQTTQQATQQTTK